MFNNISVYLCVLCACVYARTRRAREEAAQLKYDYIGRLKPIRYVVHRGDRIELSSTELTHGMTDEGPTHMEGSKQSNILNWSY